MTRRSIILSIPFMMLLLLFSLSVGACARLDPAAPESGLGSETTDPDSGVTLGAHVDRSRIETADRVWVAVDLAWSPPATATLAEPDWEKTDWTLVESQSEPIEQTPGGFVLRERYLIEPFLAGDYDIPGFSARIVSNKGDEPHDLSGPPIRIRVASVLDAGDSGQLDPARGYIDPSLTRDDEPADRGLLLGSLIAVIVIVTILVWRLTRSAPSVHSSLSVHAMLQRVAQGNADSEQDAFAMLHHAFSRLDPRLRQTSEIRSLIRACERARFSAPGAIHQDPRSMARHTLELLGSGEEVGA